MPRARRLDYAGAWHHVMNRTIDSLVLFSDDVDRRIFVTELRDALCEFQGELHGYCLMSNHYHLLVHTPDGSLSNIMQRSSSVFTQKINNRRERDGPLFRGRFNSVTPDDDPHLLNISAYIHLNPVKAGLVQSPADWEWSSAGAYFGNVPEPQWLHTAAVLAMFEAAGGRSGYQEFVLDRMGLGTGSRTGSDPMRC